jgi:hypothetical protein
VKRLCLLALLFLTVSAHAQTKWQALREIFASGTNSKADSAAYADSASGAFGTLATIINSMWDSTGIKIWVQGRLDAETDTTRFLDSCAEFSDRIDSAFSDLKDSTAALHSALEDTAANIRAVIPDSSTVLYWPDTTLANGLATQYMISADNFRKYPFYCTEFLYLTDNSFAPWLGAAVNSGTLIVPPVASMSSDNYGEGIIKSSTTIRSGYQVTTSENILLEGDWNSEIIFQSLTNDSIFIAAGWFDGATTDNGTDCVFLKFWGNVLAGRTENNGAQSVTGTTYTYSDSVRYRGKIIINADATIAYFRLYNMAGTALWMDSLTTNIPTAYATMNQLMCVWQGVVSQNLAQFDYMATWKTPGGSALTR